MYKNVGDVCVCFFFVQTHTEFFFSKIFSISNKKIKRKKKKLENFPKHLNSIMNAWKFHAIK